MVTQVFHYAFSVRDIASTRQFYGEILGCREGRSANTWVDFDFFGHQISAHVSEKRQEAAACGRVDDVEVPIPHFGCILPMSQFRDLASRLRKSRIQFIVAPRTRFEGKPGEQVTMFLKDFSGNPIEFKAFKDPREVFAT